MSLVKAKFRVHSVTNAMAGPDQSNTKVSMGAIHPSDGEIPENERYHKATPQGSVEMVVTNPEAAEHFQPGDDFYLTFEKAAA